MDFNIIIVIITFLAAVAEKISTKPIHERKGIFKKLKLVNIALVLLGVLLIVQVVNTYYTSQKEKKQESQSTEVYEKISTTHENTSNTKESIDSVSRNLKNALSYTQEELKLISELNSDMADVRGSIHKSLTEYRDLNSQYKKQLAFEKEKIENDKPDVRVTMPMSVIDSISFNYQFQLSNLGKRIADSIKFTATMILVDSKFFISGVTPLKTNRFDHNILNLPPNQEITYFVNGFGLFKNDLSKHNFGFLIIKYSYYDKMTKKHFSPQILVYTCSSFDKSNAQYGQNVDSETVKNIKEYLFLNNKEYHKIIFEG